MSLFGKKYEPVHLLCYCCFNVSCCELVMQNCSRRSLLKGMALSLGVCAAGASGINRIVEASELFEQNKVRSGLFSTIEKATLKTFCDGVIPRTNTPGAVDAACHIFVEHQLLCVYSFTEQQTAKAAIQFIEQRSVEINGKSLHSCSSEQQVALLNDIEAKSSRMPDDERQAFRLLKSLIVFGYYTSMPGATQELTYLAVPGRFIGVVPLDEIGSAYSSKDYY